MVHWDKKGTLIRSLHTKAMASAFSIQNNTKRLPMKKSYTSLSNTEFAALVRKAVRQEKVVEPKESTLQFLKNLARNYRIVPKVPEDLQGYVLS